MYAACRSSERRLRSEAARQSLAEIGRADWRLGYLNYDRMKIEQVPCVREGLLASCDFLRRYFHQRIPGRRGNLHAEHFCQAIDLRIRDGLPLRTGHVEHVEATNGHNALFPVMKFVCFKTVTAQPLGEIVR